MPRTSRWFIRAALSYLVMGFTLGALLLANKGMPFSDGLSRLLPMHIEFLVVGWVMLLVAGVATWIFPRFGVPGTAVGAVGPWLAFALLNAGVWMVALGLPVAGRAAEAAGAVAFAASVWQRVRASGLSRM